MGTRELTFTNLETFAKYIQVNSSNSEQGLLFSDHSHDSDDEIRPEPVRLEVYNTDTEKVRTVQVWPTVGWGGPGLLGADISFGLGHRLPMRKID
jgi:hypothetical protein